MESPPPEPPRSPSGSDKIWSILCHLSFFVGLWIILPLVVYLAMRRESAYVEANAREALNFHLSLILYAICCVPLFLILIGGPLLFALGIVALVFGIKASLTASEGGCYRYPLTIRFVK